MNRGNNFARLRPVPDEVLRATARKLADDDRASRQYGGIVQSLFKTMHACGGTGIAAPQIGLDLRIAVAEDGPLTFVLIDPTFSVFGKPEDRVAGVEGCLSLPGRVFNVLRYPAVRVHSHIPHLGAPLTYIARGFLARVIQHELDHLDGVLVDQAGEEIKEAA